MKQLIAVLFFALAFQGVSFAQKDKAPYKVVMDVTSPDTLVHQMVMRWVKEITDADSKAEVEVVFFAKGLGMITRNNSVVADDLEKFAKKKNVSFKVCSIAMKNNGIAKGDLLHGVDTVPDGIYEVISKQHEGWGYIKGTR